MENNDLLKEQAKRLRQVKDEITLVNNATSRSAGMGGTIAVATTYTGSFEALVVNEDAVLTPPYGKIFGKVTLASGTVLVYA